MDRLRTIQRDFKAPGEKKAYRSGWARHRHHLLTAAGLLLGSGIVIGLLPDNAEATRNGTHALDPMVSLPAEGVTLPEAGDESSAGDSATAASGDETATVASGGGSDAATANSSLPADTDWVRAQVRKGDNLSLIFARNGLNDRDLYSVMSADKAATQALKKIHPGDEVRLFIDSDGALRALAYDLGEASTLNIERAGDTWSAHVIDRPIETRVTQASGAIRDSLFLSAARAGLSDALIMELVHVFGWDIDFALDIRENDRFSLVYEEVYLDGEKLRDGRILAAEFVNRDRTFRAVRHVDAQGSADYFTPDGKSLRKAFIRTPVAFTRVSSRFSAGRFHPVLNRIRAHKGVDYAAPMGTPIKATGDGRIVFKGVKGGYGNAVIIQHGSRYSTLYGHMSSFNRKLRQGDRVAQGQVIGYVGKSGLATGPHLHYEFRVDGVHRDPLTVAFPNAAPIDHKHLAQFQADAAPLLAQLDVMRAQAEVQQPGASGQVALGGAQ